MSSITVGMAGPDVTAVAGSRTSVSTAPEAFAAQLQSVTDGTSSGVAPAVSVDVSVAQQVGTGPNPVADPAPSVATVPMEFQQTAATASVPTVAAPAEASAPVVRSDADTPQSAATSVGGAGEPSDVAGASQDTATSGARPVDPDAPLTTPPTTGRRSQRHVAVDSLPAPIAASSVIGPPTSAVDPTPAPVVAAAAGAIEPARDHATPAPSVATSELAGPPGVPTPPHADRADDSRATGEQASVVPLARITALPAAQNTSPVSASRAVGSIARSAVRVIATTSADPRAFAAALQQSTPAAPAVNPSGGVDVAVQAPPLNEQIAPPLIALRSSGPGTHVLTVTVSPEALGPVTVRAHVTGGIMRVELSAPTDQGTDALRSMLTDLKRDLSQGGIDSALSIASPNADGSAAGNSNAFGTGGGHFASDSRPAYSRAPSENPAPPMTTARSLSSVSATTGLDVFA